MNDGVTTLAYVAIVKRPGPTTLTKVCHYNGNFWYEADGTEVAL
jgi:hypothetical protein